ncbi:MAG: hypothetical protein ACKO2P_17615 [Planctomycetota bacterium]
MDPVPVSNSDQRRGPAKRFLWHALLLLIAVGFALVFRLTNGRHYGRLIVRLDERTAANMSLVLFAQRLDGSLFPLQPRPENRQIWCRDSGWPAVKSLILAGNDVGEVSPDSVKVFLGSSPLYAQPLNVAPPEEAAATDPRFRELRRRMSVADVWQVFPEAAHRSPFSTAAGSVNWLGNAALLLVACTQGFAIWLGVILFAMAVRHIAALQSQWQSSGSVADLAGRVAAESIRLILLTFTAHLCWCQLIPLITLRVPDEVSAAMIAGVITGLFVAGWVRFVQSTASDFKLRLCMVAFAAVVFATKLWWLSTVEFRPLSDYEAYHRYGAQLAAGDWEAIRGRPGGLAAIYLRRAATFAWPISRLFGSSMSAYEVVNVLTQAVTVWLLCVLIRRMFSLRTAAFSLPCLLLYPELWYLPGMVTHNIPGYLWMVLSWLAVDCFLKVSATQAEQGSRWLNRIATALLLGLTGGLSFALLELTKSYGMVCILSLAMCLFVGPLLPASLIRQPAASRAPALQRIAFFAALVVTEQSLVRTVDEFLLQKSGLTTLPNWSLNYLTAVDSTTDASGDGLFIWTHYAYSVHTRDVLPLAFRKLLHEKLGVGPEFLKCMFRKNVVLSRTADSMSLVQDNIRLQKLDAKPENVRYAAFQSTFSYLLALVIGCLFLLRLLLPGPLIRSESELFPLASSAAVMLAVYLLTEAHPYYALNLVFPFCWSAGIVFERLQSSTGSAISLPQALRMYFPRPRWLAAGAISIAVALFCVAGSAVDHSGLTFHRVAGTNVVKSTLGNEKSPAEKSSGFATTGTSRVHSWLEFNTAAGHLKAGQNASTDVTIQSEAGPLRGLRFFVAGNQRARQQRIPDAWQGLPIRYAIAINGKTIVEDRPLEELSRPRFLLVPASEWLGKTQPSATTATVTVTLTCTADLAIGRISPPPAISVEYFH